MDYDFYCSILEGNIRVLWEEELERLEGELLNIHVSFCHDTELECMKSSSAYIAHKAYVAALHDIAKRWGINMNKIRNENNDTSNS